MKKTFTIVFTIDDPDDELTEESIKACYDSPKWLRVDVHEGVYLFDKYVCEAHNELTK